MNLKEAQKTWDLSDGKAKNFCKIMDYPKTKRGVYIIPDDLLVKPYVPDRRIFKKNLQQNIYIHLMNALNEGRVIFPQLIGTDEDHIRTAVRELKERSLIILIEGREDNNRLENYMISFEYTDWKVKDFKEKVNIISSAIGTASAAYQNTRGI